VASDPTQSIDFRYYNKDLVFREGNLGAREQSVRHFWQPLKSKN